MDGIPDRTQSALIVVDMQDRFLPVIFEMGRVTENCSKLVRAFKVFGVPVLHTEQYPQGLGQTIPDLAVLFEDKPVEKIEFSCLRNKAFKEKLAKTKARSLVLCGIEAHVCVLQTALDALKGGYEVYVAQDATSSRKQTDWKTAMKRMQQSGAWRVSTEMIIFQMMEKAGSEEFKKIREIVK
jgi:nicotinamidase-related amidase